MNVSQPLSPTTPGLVNGLMDQMVIVVGDEGYAGAQKYCLPLTKADLSTADCSACRQGPMLSP